MSKVPKNSVRLVGWREWVGLPSFGDFKVKAKVDTGARTSAIHATDIEYVETIDRILIAFTIFPHQDDDRTSFRCQAPLVETRAVTDSGGHKEDRYIVETSIRIGDMEWPIELSLTNRIEMGFRMLLGRHAVRNRFLVDPGRSYLSGASASLIVSNEKQSGGSS